MSSLEAQNAPTENGKGKPKVGKSAPRSASSNASRARTVDPRVVPNRQTKYIDDEPQ